MNHEDEPSGKSLSTLLPWFAVQTVGTNTCPFRSDHGPSVPPCDPTLSVSLSDFTCFQVFAVSALLVFSGAFHALAAGAVAPGAPRSYRVRPAEEHPQHLSHLITLRQDNEQNRTLRRLGAGQLDSLLFDLKLAWRSRPRHAQLMRPDPAPYLPKRTSTIGGRNQRPGLSQSLSGYCLI